jgi:hypothetical protein
MAVTDCSRDNGKCQSPSTLWATQNTTSTADVNRLPTATPPVRQLAILVAYALRREMRTLYHRTAGRPTCGQPGTRTTFLRAWLTAAGQELHAARSRFDTGPWPHETQWSSGRETVFGNRTRYPLRRLDNGTIPTNAASAARTTLDGSGTAMLKTPGSKVR